jgi:hypothetical protein
MSLYPDKFVLSTVFADVDGESIEYVVCLKYMFDCSTNDCLPILFT